MRYLSCLFTVESSRRTVLGAAALFTVCFYLDSLKTALLGLPDKGDKVGPPPALPPLPPRPYPHRRTYLLTDGSFLQPDCFAAALHADCMAKAGAARSIPYGLTIKTAEQKLWLLGRRTFATSFDHDLSKMLARAKAEPFNPTWTAKTLQIFEPMRTTPNGTLVRDPVT